MTVPSKPEAHARDSAHQRGNLPHSLAGAAGLDEEALLSQHLRSRQSLHPSKHCFTIFRATSRELEESDTRSTSRATGG